MASPFPVPNSTLGVLLIGTLVSYVLFGVTTTQTYIYCGRFPNDPLKLKLLVALVWLLEVAHGVCTGHSLYKLLISDYTHPDRLALVPQSMLVSIVFTSAIAFCVECFFSFRIYSLSKIPYIPSVTCLLASLRLVFSIFLIAYWRGKNPTVMDFLERTAWVCYINWGASTTAELIIAITLVYTLYGQRVDGNKRTVALVNKIIKWTIETGVILRQDLHHADHFNHLFKFGNQYFYNPNVDLGVSLQHSVSARNQLFS